MKRSKMIKILKDQFELRGMASEMGAKVAANEILTIIEESGMLPPEIEIINLYEPTREYISGWERE